MYCTRVHQNFGSAVDLHSAPLQMSTAVKVRSCRSEVVEAALDTRNPKTLTNPKSSSTSTNEGATAGSSPADLPFLKNRLITRTWHHLTSFLPRVIKFFFFHVNMKPVRSSFTSTALLNLLGYICLVFCELDNRSFSYTSQFFVYNFTDLFSIPIYCISLQ